jgi:hypothetical protein
MPLNDLIRLISRYTPTLLLLLLLCCCLLY